MPRLLHITDLHLRPQADDRLAGILPDLNLKAVLEEAYQVYSGFDLIIISGDLAQEPCLASYQRIREILTPYQTQVLSVAGNHDSLEMMQTVLNSGQFSCATKLAIDSWQIICVNSQQANSNQGWVSPAEIQQLELAFDNPDPCLLVIHHHFLDTGSPWMDRMKIANAAEFLEVIAQQEQLKLVIHGHIHQELQWRYQDIHVVATPSTAVQFAPLAPSFQLTTVAPGFRVIELEANGNYTSHCHYLSHPPQTPDLVSKAY